MPITRIDRDPLPYVRPAYEPDTRTLAQLMALVGQSRANQAARQGAVRAQNLMTLGQIIGGGLASLREERNAKEAAAARAEQQAREDAFKVRDQQLREADLMARIKEREDAAAERAQAQAYKRGTEVADEVGYGPMSEPQMESVLQGPAAGRARYSFGPGTAEGPELMPTRPQQRAMDVEKSIQAMGGQIGPNGQVVMPPRPSAEPNPTEASLALLAARGDVGAQKALERLRALRAPQPTDKNPIPVMGPDGNPIYVRPEAALGMRPPSTREQPTEDERKTAGFYKRMVDASRVMDEVEGQLTPKDIYQIQSLPQEDLIGLLNRGQMSNAAKRYVRAMTQFTEARLRADSGAAISAGEYASDRQVYAKQYGETPELSADRKQARTIALEALQTRAARGLSKTTTPVSGGGFIEAIDTDGNIHHAPAGTPLPKGWRLKQ